MSRQRTEEGLGELGGLLPSVRRVVSKTPGMKVYSFLLVASIRMMVFEYRRLWVAGTQETLVAEC